MGEDKRQDLLSPIQLTDASVVPKDRPVLYDLVQESEADRSRLGFSNSLSE